MTEYSRRKRRQLMSMLNRFQRKAWELKEKEKKRALTPDEVKDAFGWVNWRGQYVEPRVDGGWKGLDKPLSSA